MTGAKCGRVHCLALLLGLLLGACATPGGGPGEDSRDRVTASDETDASKRARVLQDAGLVATVRKTRGDDIAAACGQLAGEVQDRTRVVQRMQRAPVRWHAKPGNAPRAALTGSDESASRGTS